jgi:hypothetical protein
MRASVHETMPPEHSQKELEENHVPYYLGMFSPEAV